MRPAQIPNNLKTIRAPCFIFSTVAGRHDSFNCPWEIRGRGPWRALNDLITLSTVRIIYGHSFIAGKYHRGKLITEHWHKMSLGGCSDFLLLGLPYILHSGQKKSINGNAPLPIASVL